MSNVVFELFAKLGLDSTGYENGLNNAKAQSSSFGTAVGNGFKTVAKVGVAALATVTTAATAFATSSVKTGAEFDTAMSQVAATLGLTVEDIKNNVNGAGETFDTLREKARELGGSTIYSASEAAEGLNILAMSGYNAEQSMDMLEDVLHLAAAGSMDMASAAAYVSGSMKGFNDASKDSAYYADLMAKGATLANTSVQELGEAMSDGSATAAAYGQSAESMTVSLLRLAEQGEVGSAAGTALAAAMKDIYTGTDQAQKALQELGVDAYDPVTHQARDFNDVINDLEAAMADMTDEERNNYKQTIFGIQGLNAYNKMVVSGTEKQEEWAEALANSTGEAGKQYETMTSNLEGAVKGWSSALDDFKISISDKLTPTISEFVSFGTAGLQSITKAFESDGISGAMKAFQKVFTDGLNKITEEIPHMIEIGTQLLGAIGQGLLDSAPTLLDAGVQIIEQLADAMISGFPQVIGSISELIPTVMSKMTDLVLSLATKLSDPDSVQSMIQGGLSLIMALAQGLSENLPKIIEAAPKIITGLIQGIVQSLPMLIDGAIQILSGLVQFIIENLPLIIAAAYEIIFSLASGLIEALPSLLLAGVQLVTSLVASLNAALPKFLANGMEITKAIVNGILSLLSSIAKAALDLVNKFIQTVIAQKEQLFDNGKKIIEMVKDGIKEKIDDAKQWGQDLIENFINGIKEKWEALKSTVSDVAASIKAFLGFSEPEKGPLSNFHTYAPDMMDLFMQGIEDNKARLLDTVADAFNFRDIIVSPSASVEAVGASGFNQTVNIYSPEELSPSEVARQTKNATRDMLLELRGL